MNFRCSLAGVLAVTLVSLVSLAMATPLPGTALEPRQLTDQSAAELAAINTLSTGLVTLNGTLNKLKLNDPLGFLEALKVQQQTTAVINNLKSAAQIANSSAPFTKDESGAIAVAVVNLEPVIFSTLNNVVAHKPAFATALFIVGDLTKTVENSLVQQRELSAAFSTSLASKLTEPYAGFAPLIAAQIDNAFATAIAAYKNCEGLICLPPISLPPGIPLKE
jgi:hypothetical protein